MTARWCPASPSCTPPVIRPGIAACCSTAGTRSLLLTGDLLHLPIQAAHPDVAIEPRRGPGDRAPITGRDPAGRAPGGSWTSGVHHFAEPFGTLTRAVETVTGLGGWLPELSLERVVVALGGNALLRRGADDTFEEMYRACREAAERIADIAADGWEVVVTHGNGPQVGRILLQQEAARDIVHPMPLDVCGAESQGQIGYLLQVTIGDVFFERGMERPVATVLTLTRVRPDDPCVRRPHEVRRALLRGRRKRARLESERGYIDEGRPSRGLAPGGAQPDPVLDRRDAGDRASWWPTASS